MIERANWSLAIESHARAYASCAHTVHSPSHGSVFLCGTLRRNEMPTLKYRRIR